jgi:hypothetical protein
MGRFYGVYYLGGPTGTDDILTMIPRVTEITDLSGSRRVQGMHYVS